jgi:hypothetical protein
MAAAVLERISFSVAKRFGRAVVARTRAVVHTVDTAIHKSISIAHKAVSATSSFIKHHAASIAQIAVGAGVFIGCSALTGGLGTIGCAALAGAAASGVSYGESCSSSKNGCTVLGAVESIGIGAVGGVVGGALAGPLGGKLVDEALDGLLPDFVGSALVGGYSGGGAGATTGALDYASSCSSSASGCSWSGLGSATGRGAIQGTITGGIAGGAAPVAGRSWSRLRGSAADEAPACHSFTATTRVLMADGSTKQISRIKAGDQIANSVPGRSRVEDHAVTKVIVTTTDHDFVDVTVGRAPADASGRTVKPTTLKKAAIGLAAALITVAGPAADLTAHSASTNTSTNMAALAPSAAQQPTASVHATSAAVALPGGTLTTTFHHPFYDITQAAFIEAQHLHPGDLLQTPTGTAQITAVRPYYADTTTYDLTIGDLHTYYVEAGSTPVLVHNCGNAPRVFAVDSSGEASALPVHTIDSTLYPDVADNFNNALANGESPIVTRLTGRAAIRANRSAAQAGVPRPGTLGTDAQGGALSWEEFPFASTQEGGAGATLRLINRTQNISHGRDSLWPFLRDNGVDNGDQYYVRVK